MALAIGITPYAQAVMPARDTPPHASRGPEMSLLDAPQALWERILAMLKKNNAFISHQHTDTPQALWGRIVTLLKKNKAFTSRQDVEEILGFTFTDVEKDGDKRILGAQFFYSTRQEVEGLGLVSIGLFDDPKKIRLSVGWGHQYFETPNCMDIVDVTSDLVAMGWETSSRPLTSGSGLEFYRAEDVAEYKRDVAEHGKTDKRLGIFNETTWLVLDSPNQYSQCVNGFTANIWLRAT